MNFATHSTLFSKLLCRVPHVVRKVRTALLNILFIFSDASFRSKTIQKVASHQGKPNLYKNLLTQVIVT